MGTLQTRARQKVNSFTRIVVLLIAALYPLLTGQATGRAAATSAKNQNEYVGSNTCAQCHRAIYQQFTSTHMGRSLSLASPETFDALGTPSASLPSSSYDPKLDRHFETYLRDGKLFQSEFQAGQDGNEIFRDAQQIKWIIGSGMNGFGGIVERDHYLFQGPQSFYTKAKTWAASPGYEFVDFGFNRPVLAGCIFCHSGRAKPIAASNGRYADPAFDETAIGCENCHGPGAEHVHTMKDGPAHGRDGANSIVNPARLTADLANNICMSCHQTGDLRILKAGKEFSDFRPGKPLDDTFSILTIPPDPSKPPEEDHLEHYYSMTLSKCYRASGESCAALPVMTLMLNQLARKHPRTSTRSA